MIKAYIIEHSYYMDQTISIRINSNIPDIIINIFRFPDLELISSENVTLPFYKQKNLETTVPFYNLF